MSCKGLHCPGCGHGGGGLAALVVLAVIIIAAIARPVAHAAGAVGHAVLEALEITGIVLVSTAGLAVLGGMAYGAHRACRWHANRVTAVSFHPPVAQRGSEALSARRGRAIEAARPRLIQLHPERIEEEK
jgi:hypothetical protein